MRIQHPWWSGFVAAALGGLVSVTAVAAGEQLLPLLSVREGAVRSAGIPLANGFICARALATGTHFPLIQDILKYVYARGKGAGPESAVGAATWLRGVLNGLLTAEGLRSQRATGAFLHTRVAPHERVQAMAPRLMLIRCAP